MSETTTKETADAQVTQEKKVKRDKDGNIIQEESSSNVART